MKRSPFSAEAETPKPNGLSVRQKSYGCMLPAFLFLKSNKEKLRSGQVEMENGPGWGPGLEALSK